MFAGKLEQFPENQRKFWFLPGGERTTSFDESRGSAVRRAGEDDEGEKGFSFPFVVGALGVERAKPFPPVWKDTKAQAFASVGR
jgi:hypothetical protein